MKKGQDVKNPKISVITLGCSKNVVDSEVLLGQLKLNDATVVDDIEQADIAVINTCGFIEAAKQESIDAIIEGIDGLVLAEFVFVYDQIYLDSSPFHISGLGRGHG